MFFQTQMRPGPEPDASQLAFRDADKIVANGYVPAPLLWGHSQPLGAWGPGARYVYLDSSRETFETEGISIVTGCAANDVFDADAALRSWLVAFSVIVASKKIGRAVDELMSTRFPKRPAVRHTTGTHDRLFVFGLDASAGKPFTLCRSIRRFVLPKDRGTGSYHYVDVISAGGYFTHSGLCTARSVAGYDSDGPAFYWPSGDLTRIPSRELPTIDYAAAYALARDIESMFEAHGAEWAV